MAKTPKRNEAGARGDLPDLTFRVHDQPVDPSPGMRGFTMWMKPEEGVSSRGRGGVSAHLPDGTMVGGISWGNDKVRRVEVHEDHQRRGIATALWERARQERPRLQHSGDFTEKGREWKNTLGMALIPHHRLPTELQQTVEAFRSHPNVHYLDDPHCATGKCGEAATDFAQFAHDRGHESSIEVLQSSRRPGGQHAVAKVDGHYVDWTVRQYNPKSQVPRVFTELSGNAESSGFDTSVRSEHPYNADDREMSREQVWREGLPDEEWNPDQPVRFHDLADEREDPPRGWGGGTETYWWRKHPKQGAIVGDHLIAYRGRAKYPDGKLRSIPDIAHEVEAHYGLPHDAVLNHGAFQFNIGRLQDPWLYASEHKPTAQAYAEIGTEPLSDALTAAWHLKHPEHYSEARNCEGMSDHGICEVHGDLATPQKAFRAQYMRDKGIRSVVQTLKIPREHLEQGKAHVVEGIGGWDKLKQFRDEESDYEGLTTVTIPRPIKPEWIVNEEEVPHRQAKTSKMTAEDRMSKGVMIALMLPEDVAKKIALEGGDPPENLHVTLVYVGMIGEDKGIPSDAADGWPELTEAVKEIADDFGPLVGRIKGTGTFPAGDEGVPFWAKPRIEGIEKLQKALVSALKVRDIDYHGEHAFKPHTTLKYLKDGEPEPDVDIDEHVEFDKITIEIGDRSEEYPLIGMSRVEKTSDLLVGPCEMCGQPSTVGSNWCDKCRAILRRRMDLPAQDRPKKKPQFTADVKLPDDVAKEFHALAQMQRGEPEHRMLDLQQVHGGGVLSWAAEHIGDISHRMTTGAPWGYMGDVEVREKVNKTHGVLTNPYGFAKEHQENVEDNAGYMGKDVEDHRRDIHVAQIAYRDAHKQLPAYNEMQWHARESAVSLGDGDYQGSAHHLSRIKQALDDGTFASRAAEFERHDDGSLKQWSPPRTAGDVLPFQRKVPPTVPDVWPTEPRPPLDSPTACGGYDTAARMRMPDCPRSATTWMTGPGEKDSHPMCEQHARLAMGDGWREGPEPQDSQIIPFRQRQSGWEDWPWEKTSSGERETSWHLTDNPKFALDPEKNPENNTTLGGDWPHKGLFVGDPESWLNGHDYVRPFVAEIEHPKLDDMGGYSGEKFLHAEQFSQSKVKRVIPLDEYARETYHEPGWIESHHGSDVHGNPVNPRTDRFPNYRYQGTDVRDMPKSEINTHLKRMNEYIENARPQLMTCKDCVYPKIEHAPGRAAWDEFGEHPYRKPSSFYRMTSYDDVRRKAAEIREDGGVQFVRHDDEVLAAVVVGDHGVYDTTIYRQFPGSQRATLWECTCKWNQYVWARSPEYKHLEGRMCSHSLATLYEAWSREYLKGWGVEMQKVKQRGELAEKPTKKKRSSLHHRDYDNLVGGQKYEHEWYHTTNNVNAIFREGIRPDLESHSEYHDSRTETRPNHVYMHTNVDNTWDNAVAGIHGNALVAVDSRMLDKKRLKPDEDWVESALDGQDIPEDVYQHYQGRYPEHPPGQEGWKQGDETLGQWAERHHLEDPAETAHSIEFHHTVAHEGVIPSHAVKGAWFWEQVPGMEGDDSDYVFHPNPHYKGDSPGKDECMRGPTGDCPIQHMGKKTSVDDEIAYYHEKPGKRETMYDDEGSQRILAVHPKHGPVGSLQWIPGVGTEWVGVLPEHQGRGIATQMWEHAKAIDPDISTDGSSFTESGFAWAQTVAPREELPEEFDEPHSDWAIKEGLKPWPKGTRRRIAHTSVEYGRMNFGPEEIGPHVHEDWPIEELAKLTDRLSSYRVPARLAGATKKYRLEEATNSDAAFGTDTSKIVHSFEDGWSIRQLQTGLDKHREGCLMHNCWRETDERGQDLLPNWHAGEVDALERYHGGQVPPGDPGLFGRWDRARKRMDHPLGDDDQPSRYYSLRDSDNLPHASFFHDVPGGMPNPVLRGGRSAVTSWVFGQHDQDPKKHHLERIREWHAALPYEAREGPGFRGGKSIPDRIPGRLLDPVPAFAPPEDLPGFPRTASTDDIPSWEPGGEGAPAIPEGHVRLFHYTNPKNIDSIRQHGLSMSHAKGETYGEPSVVWACAGQPVQGREEWASSGHIQVEFHAHPDDLDVGKWRTPEDLESGRSHVTLHRDVPPSDIVAIHEPWHGHYRYLKQNEEMRQGVLRGEYDSTLDDDRFEDYNRAIRKIKKEGHTGRHTVMYHVAYQANRKSIQQSGLRSGFPYDGPKGVYLWKSPELAERWRDLIGSTSGPHEVWEVNTSGLRIYRDPYASGVPEDEDAHYHPHDIEPDRLSLRESTEHTAFRRWADATIIEFPQGRTPGPHRTYHPPSHDYLDPGLLKRMYGPRDPNACQFPQCPGQPWTKTMRHPDASPESPIYNVRLCDEHARMAMHEGFTRVKEEEPKAPGLHLVKGSRPSLQDTIESWKRLGQEDDPEDEWKDYTPEDSYDGCFDASYGFASHAQERGHQVSMVRLTGPPDYPTAHRGWRGQPKERWQHYVAKVDGQLVDWTGRQFDPDVASPAIYSDHHATGWKHAQEMPVPGMDDDFDEWTDRMQRAPKTAGAAPGTFDERFPGHWYSVGFPDDVKATVERLRPGVEEKIGDQLGECVTNSRHWAEALRGEGVDAKATDGYHNNWFHSWVRIDRHLFDPTAGQFDCAWTSKSHRSHYRSTPKTGSWDDHRMASVRPRDLAIPISPTLHGVLQHLHSKGRQPLIVGGAVRDAILGRPSKDVDVEVYHTNYDELADTLRPHGEVNVVGQHFGVVKFKDHEGNDYDFSIPRRESTTGVGHKDFHTEFDPDITPKEAAARRDFTMNSLAYDPIARHLHDYFGGEQDLHNRVLRHTSEHFAEDPLRVLRGMQFAARYGMTLHPDTARLSASISHLHSTIPKERVGEEFMKLTRGSRPGAAIPYLQQSGWHKNFPELHAMYGAEQDPEWHPEGDVASHTQHTMNHAAEVADREGLQGDDRSTVVLAAMLHDVGKPVSTQHVVQDGKERITSHGHDAAGGPIAESFLRSIDIKPEIIHRVVPLVTQHMSHLNFDEHTHPRVVRRLAQRVAPSSIRELSYVMEADHSGRPPKPQGIPSGTQKMLRMADESHVEQGRMEPLIKGRHVMPYFDNKPGRHIGDVVNAAYEAQMNGEINTEDEAHEWLRNRMSKTAMSLEDPYGQGLRVHPDDLPETLYHVAPKKHRRSILRNGLDATGRTWNTSTPDWKGGFEGEEYAGEYRPEGIYMFHHREDAEGYKGPEHDLWEVDRKGLSDVIKDPSQVENWDYPDAVTKSYVTEHVAPQHLRRIGSVDTEGDSVPWIERIAMAFGPNADEYHASWDELPDEVYHVAPAEHRQSIHENGLQPKGRAWNFALSEHDRQQGGHWNPETEKYEGKGSETFTYRPEGAYVFVDKGIAGRFKDEYQRRHGQHMDVHAIDVNGLRSMPEHERPQVIKDPEQIQWEHQDAKEREDEPRSPSELHDYLRHDFGDELGEEGDHRQFAIEHVPAQHVRRMKPYEYKDQEDWGEDDHEEHREDHPEAYDGDDWSDHYSAKTAHTGNHEVMYHVAPKSERDSIMRHGLDPNRNQMRRRNPPQWQVGNYAWDNLSDAEEWRRTQEEDPADVWKIDASDLKANEDEEFQRLDPPGHPAAHFLPQKRIHPKLLTLYHRDEDFDDWTGIYNGDKASTEQQDDDWGDHYSKVAHGDEASTDDMKNDMLHNFRSMWGGTNPTWLGKTTGNKSVVVKEMPEKEVNNEVAATILNRHLGNMVHMPAVVKRENFMGWDDDDFSHVSVQQFHPGKAPASMILDKPSDEWDEHGHWGPLEQNHIPDHQVKNMMFFDALSGNADRHGGNMLSAPGQLTAIDHSLAFGHLPPDLKGFGHEKHLQVRAGACPHCKGSGNAWEDSSHTNGPCWKCAGSGKDHMTLEPHHIKALNHVLDNWEDVENDLMGAGIKQERTEALEGRAMIMLKHGSMNLEHSPEYKVKVKNFLEGVGV